MSAPRNDAAELWPGLRSVRDADVLATLIAAMQDCAIVMLDVEGRVASWNVGAQGLKGYAAQEIIGRHFSVFYPPDEIAAGKPEHQLEVAAADGRLEDEGWRVRKDGSRFWANVVITVVRDQQGELRGYGKVTRDLSERREHELALAERERLVRGVLEAVTEYSIIATDLGGTITVFNPGAERMLGYRSQELVGIHTPALIHDSDEVAARARELGIAPGFEVFALGPREGRAETREWTYVRKDGSRLPVELTATAIRGDDQMPRGFIGIAVDLTERRGAEAELRAAVQEAGIMETAFSDAPGGVALIAMDGRYLRVNESLCAILGRSAQEIVGSTSARFAHPEDLLVTADAYTALRAGGAGVRVEKRYLRPDGQVVWTSTSSTAIAGSDGELTHIVCHFHDVTEQRMVEAQLRASEENLRTVAAVARQLPSHENPRHAICVAAAGIAGADIVQLWEPDGDDYLHVTAATGIALSPDLRLPLTGVITGTAIAYHSGQRGVFLDLHAPEAPASARLRDRFGAASAVCEPVTGRDGPLGVLVVIWKTAITHASAPVIDAVGLLATEAAAAIERADLTARLGAQSDAERLRLRQLLEGAPDAMIISDTAGVIETVNDETLRLLGYAREQLIGTSVDQLVPSALRAGQHPSAWAIGVARELMARHQDGSEIPVEITLSPVQTDGGTLVMAAVRDITDRRVAQARLKAAEEQFRRAFDDAPIGMMISDLTGGYLQVNDSFCAILGYSRAMLLDLSRQSITHPDDLTADEEAVRRLLVGEARSFSLEKRFLHAAGHPVWTSVNVTLIRDAEDRPDHFITQAQDITERRLYENQLRHMADHDPLTGLLNRRSFNRDLDSHVARVKRSGAIGAVLMVDLDNFKYYNDTQGHSAGDALIVGIGQAVQSRLRETDVIARLGGDEFAVLLAQEDSTTAEVVAEAILEVIREEAPAATQGEHRHVSASIGIACFSDRDRLTAEEIMINADLAMYEAKESGRNAIAHYRTDQHERPRIESQTNWATKITQALAEDRFQLLAQPIQPLRGNGPTQYELLLRMRDDAGASIPPGTFLYIAERLGLIQEIDRWVVAHAIDLLAEHRAAGHDLRFEVNLSGHTIGDPDLLELIERRLRETGVPPDRLIFEITETAAVSNIARAATFAARLTELGCRFALDDFGAGFGSFYYLKHLSFDYLKIGGEYVRRCATNETDRILISAVVQIARGMGKHTIAEFVGDQATVEVLTGLGVDYGQGYFLGRPEPLANQLGCDLQPTWLSPLSDSTR
jgi:diguanylate cyclase (GGDEF)-like protein/PAS domain S-box-containing protein